MSTDRLFIAIPFNTAERSFLQREMDELRASRSFRKWVHPEDLHITLCFLGDTDPQTAEQVKSSLTSLTKPIRPFRLQFGGLGTFGKPDAPSILWKGLSGQMEPLRQLQARIVQAMEPLGFEPENRPYRPHITLAKKYTGEAPYTEAPLQDIEGSNGESASWTVDRIVLFRTHMYRQPMYETIGIYPLEGSL